MNITLDILKYSNWIRPAKFVNFSDKHCRKSSYIYKLNFKTGVIFNTRQLFTCVPCNSFFFISLFCLECSILNTKIIRFHHYCAY